MSVKLLWQAWLIMVLLCGMLFTAGMVTQTPALADAAFDPLIAGLFFLGGLACAFWWSGRAGRRG
jgi:hypothetical protein